MTDRLSNADLRRLFLERHGLADSPARPLTRDRLDALVERLGFVQVDTIPPLEQPHPHILFPRTAGYRKPPLQPLQDERRSLSERLTQDYSTRPTRFYPHSNPRHLRAASHQTA